MPFPFKISHSNTNQLMNHVFLVNSYRPILLLLFTLLIQACSNPENTTEKTPHPDISGRADFFKGADLSYANEMNDCGALYRDQNGTITNPYALFSKAGCQLSRIRLWHNPSWTTYSNITDVERALKEIKANHMMALLDFHYSDSWADPEKQIIPEAWEAVYNNQHILGDSIYNYTLKTLLRLHAKGILPDLVQIGNEINQMILQPKETAAPMDWERNVYLLKRAISAVRTAENQTGSTIEVMLHIAQPENALSWFKAAHAHQLTNYDWIGLSYYPKWSSFPLPMLGTAIDSLRNTYNKKIMVVETAYPFSMENLDGANNILDENSLLDGYPATEEGQYRFLADLESILKKHGALGLVYWEPAWISTSCHTLWGQGSHWENASMFRADGTPTKALSWYSGEH